MGRWGKEKRVKRSIQRPQTANWTKHSNWPVILWAAFCWDGSAPLRGRVTWNYHKIILRDNLCPGMNYFYPNGSNCFQNDNFLSIRHEGSLNGLMGMKITWIMSHRSHRWKVIYATVCIKSQSSLKLSYIVALRILFRHFNGFCFTFPTHLSLRRRDIFRYKVIPPQINMGILLNWYM